MLANYPHWLQAETVLNRQEMRRMEADIGVSPVMESHVEQLRRVLQETHDSTIRQEKDIKLLLKLSEDSRMRIDRIEERQAVMKLTIHDMEQSHKRSKKWMGVLVAAMLVPFANWGWEKFMKLAELLNK